MTTGIQNAIDNGLFVPEDATYNEVRDVVVTDNEMIEQQRQIEVMSQELKLGDETIVCDPSAREVLGCIEGSSIHIPAACRDVNLGGIFQHSTVGCIASEFRRAYCAATGLRSACARSTFKDLVLELTGIADAKRCFSGESVGSCVWTAINAIDLALTVVGVGLALHAGLTALRTGVRVAATADDVAALRRLSKLKCSFSADTPVLRADGVAVSISTLAPGDQVIATDPQTGQTTAETVTATHIHQDDNLLNVEIVQPDGTLARLETTDNHPFWDVATGSWTEAGQLAVGDRLRTPTATATIGGLDTPMGDAPMYNLTVADIHTFYVVAGSTPVLVHNAGCDEWAAAFQAKSGGEIKTFTGPLGKDYPLGPYKGSPGEDFFHHTVVVRDGKVFDQFHPHGIPIDEFKAKWEYGDDIDFGF